MTKLEEAVLNAALALDRSTKAALVDRLIADLDPPSPDVDAAWAAEAERRLDALDRGEVTTRPADDVLGRIEAKYAR